MIGEAVLESHKFIVVALIVSFICSDKKLANFFFTLKLTRFRISRWEDWLAWLLSPYFSACLLNDEEVISFVDDSFLHNAIYLVFILFNGAILDIDMSANELLRMHELFHVTEVVNTNTKRKIEYESAVSNSELEQVQIDGLLLTEVQHFLCPHR